MLINKNQPYLAINIKLKYETFKLKKKILSEN